MKGEIVMKQAENVRSALKKAKTETFEMFNKLTTAQQILESPEEAYAVGKMIELYSDFEELAYDQAKQIDDMEDMLKETNRMIKKIDEQLFELKKEIKKAQ